MNLIKDAIIKIGELPFHNKMNHSAKMTTKKQNTKQVFGALCVLLTLNLPSFSISRAVNLAPNPSFEQGTNNLPTGWYHPNGGATYSWSSTEAHSGSHSICISSMNANTSGGWMPTSWLPVTPGQKFRAGIWVKGNSDREAYLLVGSLDANGNFLQPEGVQSINVSYNNASWSYRDMVYTVPKNAKYVDFEIGWNNPGGYSATYICFDDLLWEEVQTPSVVSEARLDIGMPYNTDRGCANPFVGCGGQYHGFINGVCTDLVLDSYRAGGPFDIQSALATDAATNKGRYQWKNARNAEDMRRYFANNQIYLANNQAYQIGDIVFFDWDGDGKANHVLIISTVDTNGKPTKMVDASGTIPNVNPSGKAFENSWSSYYDQHVMAHGRVSGLSSQSTSQITIMEVDPWNAIRFTLTDPNIQLKVFDTNGKYTDSTYDTNLIASNNENYIPFIPGGEYAANGGSQVITIYNPLLNGFDFLADLQSGSATSYSLLIEWVGNGVVTNFQTIDNPIGANESQTIQISLDNSTGTVSLDVHTPQTQPFIIASLDSDLSGYVDDIAVTNLHIHNTSNQPGQVTISVTTSDFATQYGTIVEASQIALAPAQFSLSTGDTQNVQVQISLTGKDPGLYLGSLLVSYPNGPTIRVPVQIEVKYRNIFLPTVIR